MEIRIATADDASMIVDLIHAHAAIDGEYTPLTAAYVGQYLASPSSKVLLAIEDGRAVGLLSCSTRPDLFHAGECCLVEELIVAEDQRGQGIGGRLLDTVLDEAQQRGCAEVALSVMPDNHRALEFYRRHGLVDEAVLLERHFVPSSE